MPFLTKLSRHSMHQRHLTKKAGLDVKEYINPSFWDADKNDFTDGAYYTTFGRDSKYAIGGVHADGSTFDPNTSELNKRLSSASLMP